MNFDSEKKAAFSVLNTLLASPICDFKIKGHLVPVAVLLSVIFIMWAKVVLGRGALIHWFCIGSAPIKKIDYWKSA